MKKKNDRQLWLATLLLGGGLVHMIPAVGLGLTTLTRGFPFIQVIIGLVSVLVALVLFADEGDEPV